MKKIQFYRKLTFTITLIIYTLSCHSQGNKNSIPLNLGTQKSANIEFQIGQYVVAIFEDSKGNMWFGTLEKGVAKYDGKSLKYYTTEDGLMGNAVASIIEDQEGNIWFGTHSGLSKFDGKVFTNYGEKEGLCHHRVSHFLIDTQKRFWIATWGGICLFDSEKFIEFPLPNPTIYSTLNEDTKNWVTDIMEDSKGNIWISRDGYGVCKYDGVSFKHYTKTYGLPSNNVQSIEEAKDGSMWFGTRVAEHDLLDEYRQFGEGGLVSLQGESFSHYPNQLGLSYSDVYDVHKDSSGDLWISTTKHGVYKYNGKQFVNYQFDLSPSKAIMVIFEDSKGKIWLGCAGGLFQIEGQKIISTTQQGPW